MEEPPSRPRETRSVLAGPAGGALHLRGWDAAAPRRGLLVAVHGIGGHAGQFAGLAAELAPQGWAVRAPDLPGHGLASGPRGWVADWGELRGAVRSALAEVRAEAPELPLVLLGHSLGGTTVLDLVLRDAGAAAMLRGLVLTNPALDADGVAAWRVRVARLLSRLWPRFSLDTGIDMTLSSRDPQAVERFRSDPLRHSRCSARLGAEFLATAAAVQRRAPELRLPLLLLQSGDDRVTGPVAAERFFARVGSADKTWRLYPSSRHELLDDLDRRQVLDDLRSWLAGHGS